MRVLITVGGGGHFSPALAVIQQMPSDWKVILVGRKYTFEGEDTLSLEYQTAEHLQIPFKSLTTGRLQRKLSKHTLKSLLKVPVGLAQATSIIREFKPDVVVSFGGYVSVPIALAAKALRIPIVIHEQTLQAGLANKIVSKFADKICISWAESADYFPDEKTVLTGNPLREDFLEEAEKTKTPSESGNKLIYVTGGSGGAHGINVLIEEALPKLVNRYRIIHQTGDAQEFGDYSRLEAARAQLPHELQKRYLIKKFIQTDQVVHILSQADLVISRSGVNTVTELLYLGKPCILIPLLAGQKDEQKTNALLVEKIGLGKMMQQYGATPDSLVQTVDEMMQNLDTYTNHKEEAKDKIFTDAAEKIIEIITTYAKKESSTT